MGYNLKNTHFRDIYGSFLWEEPLSEEHRLFQPGETFTLDQNNYEVKRIAIVDNTQHVNVELIVEEVIIHSEPHF